MFFNNTFQFRGDAVSRTWSSRNEDEIDYRWRPRRLRGLEKHLAPKFSERLLAPWKAGRGWSVEAGAVARGTARKGLKLSQPRFEMKLHLLSNFRLTRF